jgi:phenylpropionate dioxygenase-like ring-hydroxylating dioxygenase large terminal subunit
VSQIKLLMSRLDAGTTVDAGGLRRNPTWVYTDPELAERERQLLFRGRPHLLGLSGELAAPGAFVTSDDLGLPVLALRTATGRFRAFANTCRHRGAVVEARARGVATAFTCPFHGWSYDLDGALVDVPKREHVGLTDDPALVELPAEERHGMLWIHPDPTGELDVRRLLGEDLDDELAEWDLAALRYLEEDRWEVACNWKLAMDSFGETYHFPQLHRDTLSPQFHANVQCYDAYGLHHRMLLCRREIDDLRGRPEDEWEITTATRVAYWLFPNVQLMPFTEGAYVLRAYPDRRDPGRHVSRISFFARPDADLDGNVLRDVAAGFARTIRDEDYAMSAGQQRSAEGGAVPEIVFGRNEPALHHFHSAYRSVLGLPALDLDDDLG